MKVHFSEFKNITFCGKKSFLIKTTKWKSQVTCKNCLKVLEFYKQANSDSADQFVEVTHLFNNEYNLTKCGIIKQGEKISVSPDKVTCKECLETIN